MRDMPRRRRKSSEHLIPWSLRARFTIQWWLMRVSQRQWLLAAAVLAVLHVIGLHFLPATDPAPLTGFRGNVISSLTTGLIFVCLGLHLNQKVERIVVDQERRRKDKERMDGFLNFLRYERYHNVVFPKLATPLRSTGLEYVIEPGGKPHVTEMETSYVVKVRSIAYEQVLSDEALAEYENAPIHLGEHYFCRYFNGRWHMGSDVVGEGWHEFYLAGKEGELQTGITANEFVGASTPPEGSTQVCLFYVREDGSPMTGSGGCTDVRVFKAPDGAFLLQVHDSPPKRIIVPSIHQPEITIEKFQGYFVGNSRPRFMSTLVERLRRAGILTG